MVGNKDDRARHQAVLRLCDEVQMQPKFRSRRTNPSDSRASKAVLNVIRETLNRAASAPSAGKASPRGAPALDHFTNRIHRPPLGDAMRSS